MSRLSKTLTVAALSAGALVALPAAGQAAAAGPSAGDRPVVEWNDFLLGIQATPGAQPATTHPTYDLAMLHAAIDDAVVSIDHGVHASRAASAAAAADAAARDTLVRLYPAQQASVDQEYAAL